MKRLVKNIGIALLGIVVVGFSLPERVTIPVLGATPNDWNSQSFWFEPWGASVVHKGIDIFGKKGETVVSTVDGIVLYAGTIERGGNVILVLGPKWRVHYYAHLETIQAKALQLVTTGDSIGSLGSSGNALGKHPHLHYSIVRLYPAFWEMDSSTHGYKKAIYINPNKYLREKA